MNIEETIEDILKRIGILETDSELSKQKQTSFESSITKLEKDFEKFYDKQDAKTSQLFRFMYIATGVTIALQVVALPLILYILLGKS